MIFVMTLCGRGEHARRELIRESWGTRGSLARAYNTFVHAFFVGNHTCLLPSARRRYDVDCLPRHAGQPASEQSALQSEARAHGDLVMLEVVDGYYRGLLPKFKKAFAWVVQHTRAQWVLKADTDLFARPMATAHWVRQLDPTRMSVLGWLWGRGPVPTEPCSHDASIQTRCGKAGLEARHLNMLRGIRIFPPYPVGSAGYLLSRPVATFIAQHDGDELSATDVSLGLWLSRSPRPVRLISAPDAFYKAGDGKTCLRKPRALVCCHGSMGPRNLKRCGNSSWEEAPPLTEAGLDALPACPGKLPAPLEHRCILFRKENIVSRVSRSSRRDLNYRHTVRIKAAEIPNAGRVPQNQKISVFSL